MKRIFQNQIGGRELAEFIARGASVCRLLIRTTGSLISAASERHYPLAVVYRIGDLYSDQFSRGQL
jgi:hypothetical protein